MGLFLKKKLDETKSQNILFIKLVVNKEFNITRYFTLTNSFTSYLEKHLENNYFLTIQIKNKKNLTDIYTNIPYSDK